MHFRCPAFSQSLVWRHHDEWSASIAGSSQQGAGGLESHPGTRDPSPDCGWSWAPLSIETDHQGPKPPCSLVTRMDRRDGYCYHRQAGPAGSRCMRSLSLVVVRDLVSRPSSLGDELV